MPGMSSPELFYLSDSPQSQRTLDTIEEDCVNNTMAEDGNNTFLVSYVCWVCLTLCQLSLNVISSAFQSPDFELVL